MFALPVLVLDAAPAQADVSVRVSGKVRVRAGARVRVRPRRRVVRRHYRVTPAPTVRLHTHGGVYWGGAVYVGPRYAAPPPPPPATCDCGPGYSEGYSEGYAPPPPPPRRYAAAPVTVAAPAPVPAPLPRLGIGAFVGSVDVDDRVEGSEAGIIGRLRLTRRLYLEGEVARTELADTRVDRRLGGALLFDFSPRSRFSFNLLGGAGVTQSEVGGVFTTEQTYGELGLGLTYRPTRHFHLTADVRAGARQAAADSPDSDALKLVAPSDQEDEPFTRGRLSAIVYF
ncbi:hypothetical protein [Haliangium sp.]|uniref:hypothetical protein n=1 Tax=Haliangium sp. TaxID=2663208 RepID=UPI003D096B16